MLKYTMTSRKSGDKLRKALFKRVLKRAPGAGAYPTIDVGIPNKVEAL
jgi:hypothetical protein